VLFTSIRRARRKCEGRVLPLHFVLTRELVVRLSLHNVAASYLKLGDLPTRR
jgi:hypothetical protein